MTRRFTILLVALLPAPNSARDPAALHAAEASAPIKPNIVLLVADDLGYNDLGCYGASLVKAPRIDALARQGVRFTDAHSMHAICTPSRYSLLSGTYYFHAKFKGQYPLMFHEGQVTLPSIDDRGQIKPDASQEQLYDLATDLRQTRNLAAEQPERLRAMRVRLAELAGPVPGGKAAGRRPAPIPRTAP
jgi:arylsulfatase A-like enzyme